MAKEVLEKIKSAEVESDQIIADANEKAKNILKDVDQKIKDDGDKIISEAKIEAQNLEKHSIEEAEKKVNSLLSSEEENKLKELKKDVARLDNEFINSDNLKIQEQKAKEQGFSFPSDPTYIDLGK